MLTKIKHEFPFHNIRELYHSERTFVWNDLSMAIFSDSVVGWFQLRSEVIDSVEVAIYNNSIRRRNVDTN